MNNRICDRCMAGDVIVVKISERKYFARPVRTSRCRRYKPSRMDLTCSTAVYDTSEKALLAWLRGESAAKEAK